MSVTPTQYFRLLARLQKVSEQEASLILKALPSVFRDQIKGLTFKFDDRPSKAMIENGIDPDRLCLTDTTTQVIHIFLMNIHDRHAKIPGDFRKELRRLILTELADYAGVEMDLGD